MKLAKLFEGFTVRQAFLEFQQKLIELDDGFEQADPVMLPAVPHNGPMKVTLYFVRPQESKTHKIRYIELTCFTYDHEIENYRIVAMERAQGAKMPIRPGKRVIALVVDSIDNAITYLERVMSK